MKNIMKGITLAAMAAFLAGCDEVKFNGLLEANEAITFAQDLKAFTPEENYRGPAKVTVAPGQYKAKAILGKSGSKKQIKLEIDNAGDPTVVKIQFDKNVNLNGDFTLAAADIQQAFDLKGNITTRVEKSQEYTDYEHCTYQVPHTVCRSAAKSATASEMAAARTLAEGISEFAAASAVEAPEASNPEMAGDKHTPPPGHIAPPPPPHQPVCHTVWMDRPGTMYVRYYLETTLRDLKAGFVQEGRTLASYTGNSSETRRMYTYQGPCR